MQLKGAGSNKIKEFTLGGYIENANELNGN